MLPLLVALGVLVAIVLLGVAGVVALGRARDQGLERALEPFYVPPDPLPPGQPGDIIRQEPLDAPEGVRVWRVLYRSTTFEGAPAAVSGLIAVPDRAPPPGGFPVVTMAHGTVGTARICAPSLSPFRTRSVLPSFLSPDEEANTYFRLLIEPFTDAGYAVAATDYRGLGTPGPSPYLIGEDEARNVLDAARAIRRAPDLTLSDQTLIWGQSQGGHSAAFAGQIAGRYAPELRVLGIVLGAPAAELGLLAGRIAMLTDRSPLTALFVTIVRAWSGNLPGLDAATVLTSRGVKRMEVVDRACIADVLLAFSFRDAPAYIRAEGISTPEWQQQLSVNTAGGSRMVAPVRVFQGTSDQVIPPEFTDAFVERLCGLGGSVAYQSYPGLGHIDAILPSMPDTIAWMADRLAGRPPPTTC